MVAQDDVTALYRAVRERIDEPAASEVARLAGVKTAESANNVAAVLTVPLAFLSDAYIPLDRFPPQGAGALRLLPSTQFEPAPFPSPR